MFHNLHIVSLQVHLLRSLLLRCQGRCLAFLLLQLLNSRKTANVDGCMSMAQLLNMMTFM